MMKLIGHINKRTHWSLVLIRIHM